LKTWLQAHSGKAVYPLDLQIDQVTMEDIPIALSRKNRFNGHSVYPYSVAQHCVEGAGLLKEDAALAFLLHEVSEVYLPDIPTPIKPYLHVATPKGAMTWSALEGRHAAAIFAALGVARLLPLLSSPEVHAMDLAMLAAEKRDLMAPEPHPWGVCVAPADCDVRYPWSPDAAAQAWRNAFGRLS